MTTLNDYVALEADYKRLEVRLIEERIEVIAVERERCAKIAEVEADAHAQDGEIYIARRIADEIRKRPL